MVRSLRNVGSNFMVGALMLIGIVAMQMANISANYCGLWWFYQPKVPQTLIKKD